MGKRAALLGACLCLLLGMLVPLPVWGDAEHPSDRRPADRPESPIPDSADTSGQWIRDASTIGPDGALGIAVPDDTAPDGQRVWDGHDPFHQPVDTTNYYGSGDVDLVPGG